MSARGKNPRSLANLRPVKKGEIRNPRGVNSKRPFSEQYFAISGEVVPEAVRCKLNRRAGFTLHPKGTTWREADARALHLQAAKGDVSAVKELADRIEGKSPQRLEIAAPVRQEVTIRVRYDRRKPPREL